MTGADIDALDDDALATAIGTTTVFARVSPEGKARIVRVQRRSGGAVAFLGDGVNDALALHAADVGISVDSATDVAKDAADVILLEKDLDVLADGVAEGRRIFANTIKYVLMGTSSNFGNMFSAAGASLFLSFLPMLPSQILLNNLLYDSSQLAIPTDNVDEEQLRRPSHWDIGFIRRFMIFFGPLSSVFDFVTFGVMLWVFHAGAAEFRSGWFVESLATQTLVIFAIRTRRIPFFRSHPSLPLVLAALGVVVVGSVLPATPLAHTLGFRPLPALYFAALAAMVIGYLVLIEVGKRIFYRTATADSELGRRTGDRHQDKELSTAPPPASARRLLQHIRSHGRTDPSLPRNQVIDMTSLTEPRLASAVRRAAVRATLAPSIHNTQPWRFLLSGTSLEVHADWSRRLRVLDPRGRQLLISCGCAVFNARVALAAAGYDATVERWPDPAQPNLVARLTLARTTDRRLALWVHWTR